jgi:hypothetical protein
MSWSRRERGTKGAVRLRGKAKVERKKIYIICLSFLVCFLSLEDVSGAAEIEIENDLTASHIKAPKVDAYFIPPADMSPSDRFMGFESGGRNIEVIVADIKTGYQEVANGFTDAALGTRGVQVGSRAVLTINGANATLLKALHLDDGKKWGKWILLLDSGESTLVVNGVFTSGDGEAARDVEAMLKSVVVKKEGLAPVKREPPEADSPERERETVSSGDIG